MDYIKERVKSWLDQYGSPLYVFDEVGFTENFWKLNHAMSSLYGKYQISYSFKTNYTPYICATVKRLGAYAEVVSGMEYALAKRIGYNDRQIIFNGPNKGNEGIDAFLHGAIVNVDHLRELERLCKVAKQHPDTDFKIGLRVNPEIGQNFESRFGMDKTDLETAFQMVQTVSNLKIAGLHCHISRCRGLNAWKKRTEYMLTLADRFFNTFPEYIDLGSGMYGSMSPEFAAQFNDIPSYEQYAQVTAGIFAKHYQGVVGPTLITEPGTTLISRFVECIATIEAIKQIRGHFYAVLNCSIHNLGETCLLKRIPIRVISTNKVNTYFEAIDLTGYTCLEQDILFPGYQGILAEGDFVAFENIGGYSNVLKPPFINPNCAMISVREDSSVLIKKAESNDDVFQTYIFEDNY